MRCVGLVVLFAARVAWGQEGVFLTEPEAPRAVFPTADAIARDDVAVTAERRARVTAALAGAVPSLWEDHWLVFRATQGATPLGRAIVVEEIGKHRPITFVVGVRPDRTIADVAVMAYREAYGSEIRSRRFIAQYAGKGADADLRQPVGIRNVAGATLSVEAASRAVRKAQAIAAVLDAEAGR